MNEDETRVWPEPGDLCSLRGSVFLVKDVVYRGGYMTWGDFHNKMTSQKEACIIITTHRFSSFNLGSRSLIYVLTADGIGWDDYGNYDVLSRHP